MDNITIGQVAVALAFVAALIASVKSIGATIKKAIEKAIEKAMKPTNDKIDKIDKKIDQVDMNTCKNFLVARLDELERGEKLDGIAEERFWEQYQHYLNLGGNTYIQHKVEQLQDQDIL